MPRGRDVGELIDISAAGAVLLGGMKWHALTDHAKGRILY